MNYHGDYKGWDIFTELIPHNGMLEVRARKDGELIKQKLFGYTEEEAVADMKLKIDEWKGQNE